MLFEPKLANHPGTSTNRLRALSLGAGWPIHHHGADG